MKRTKLYISFLLLLITFTCKKNIEEDILYDYYTVLNHVLPQIPNLQYCICTYKKAFILDCSDTIIYNDEEIKEIVSILKERNTDTIRTPISELDYTFIIYDTLFRYSHTGYNNVEESLALNIDKLYSPKNCIIINKDSKLYKKNLKYNKLGISRVLFDKTKEKAFFYLYMEKFENSKYRYNSVTIFAELKNRTWVIVDKIYGSIAGKQDSVFWKSK